MELINKVMIATGAFFLIVCGMLAFLVALEGM